MTKFDHCKNLPNINLQKTQFTVCDYRMQHYDNQSVKEVIHLLVPVLYLALIKQVARKQLSFYISLLEMATYSGFGN